jgi:DNA-binding transcriptional ArsR family regulator
MHLAETFKAFSDPSRLRILHLLLQQPLCVCHLQAALELPQVNVSQHLAYLRRAGLVDFERRQTWKIYRLCSPWPPETDLSFQAIAKHAEANPGFRSDLTRLKATLTDPRFPACGEKLVTTARHAPSKTSREQLKRL